MNGQPDKCKAADEVFNASRPFLKADESELCDNAMTQMCTIMTGHRHEHNINETFRLENEINLKRQHLKSDNIRAVDEHEYDYIVGTMYIDLINECEKLGYYVVNVVQARFGKQ